MIKPTLGIIGGMGVQSTGLFYDMLHNLQTIEVEQDYIDVILYSKPSTPDRTAYITGMSCDSPLGSILQAARTLESAGVACIAIPCVTSHMFYKDLSRAVSVPVINMLEETARLMSERGYGKIGLLATDGTLRGRFFHVALEKAGIEVSVPAEGDQAVLMRMIYSVKRGETVAPEALDAITVKLLRNGVQAVLLGCTELSMIIKGCRDVYIDALEVLARASITLLKNI
jgi:aspartate racemase